MAQDVLITPASTKIAFTDSGDTTTVLKTSSGRFEFKDSGESNFVDIYANDIVLDGNLTVGGTTTTVNTSNVLVEDPILQLAKGQTSGSPSIDIGFVGLRGDSNNAAFIWDESADQFAAILTTGDGSSTTLTPASYAGLKAGASFFTGGITVENSLLRITSGAPNLIFSVPSGGLDSRIFNDGSGNFIIGHGDNSDTPTERLRINSSGNATFSGNITVGPSNNSKIYMGGNDYIAFTDGVGDGFKFVYDNTERLRITNTGKVGIGTSSPDSMLEIVGGGYNSSLKIKGDGADTGIQFEDSAGNTDGYIYANGGMVGFLDAGTHWTIQCKDDDYIKFLTNNGTEHMRITSSGSVGIGIATPAAKLNVVLDSSATNTPTDVLRLGHTSTGSTAVGFGALIRFDGERTGSTVDGMGRLGFVADVMTASRVDGAFIVQTGADGTYTERMRITSTGKVGIGTNAPANTLHVQKDVDDFIVKLENDGNSTSSDGLWLDTRWNTASNTVLKVTSNSGSANFFYIKGDGNVGIGTAAPGKKLQISAGDGDHLLLQYSGSTNNSGAVRQLFQRSTGTEASPAGTSDGVIIGTTSYVAYAPSGSSYRNSAAIIVTRHGAANTVSAPAKIALATPGTGDDTLIDRLTILPGGSVGIGATSPTVGLQVGNSVSGQTETVIFNSEGGAEVGLKVKSRTNRAKLLVADNDTSAYIVAENGVLGFGSAASASSNNLNVLANGSVGVGTTAPDGSDWNASAKLLHIYQNDTNGALVKLESSSTSLMVSAGNAHAQIAVTESVPMKFYTAGVLRFTIGASGGIRFNDAFTFPTADGSANQVLQTNGSGTLSWSSAGTGTISGSGTDHYIPRFNGTGALQDSSVIALDSGSVGIGISAPAVKLHNHTTSGHNSIYLTTDGNSSSTTALWFAHNYTAAADWAGIIWGDDNLLRINNSGSSSASHIVINESGSVGIGTTSPTTPLHVVGNTVLNGVLFFGSTSGSFINQDSSNLRLAGDNGVKLQTYDGGWQNRLTIIDNGNVGIGTASPEFKLQVENTVAAGSDNFILNVRNPTHASDSRAGIAFRMNNNTGSNWDGAGIQATNDGVTGAGHLTFGSVEDSTYTERVRIKVDGNVGIGTTSPTYKLHVAATSTNLARFDAGNTNNWISITSGNSYSAGILYENAGSPKWYVGHYNGNPDGFSFYDASTSAVKVFIKEGGSVGIGTTSPAQKLSVFNGKISVSDGYNIGSHDGGTGMYVDEDTDIRWQVGDSLKMKLDSNGRLGIGTTTPSAELQVHSGDILITSGRQLITNNAYTNAPPAMLTVQGPSAGNTTLSSNQWGIMIGPQHNRITTANTYYPGIAFNHLLNHSNAATYNNAPQAWIGTRLYDTPGSERSSLVFATKSGTGTTSSDVPIERMMINPLGSVGIGTTSPAALLHIESNGSHDEGAEIFLKHDNSNSTDIVGTVLFGNNAGGVAMIQGGTTGANNTGYISFSTDNAGTSSEKVRILGNGSVGIATASPSSANKLEVNGQVRGTTAMFGNSATSNVAAQPVHIKYGGPASLRLEDSTSSNLVYDLTSDHGTGFIIRDSTAGTNRLVIDQSTGDATFSNDVIITGDLTVNGDATTVNTTNLLVEDPLVVLAKAQSGTPSLDAGLIIERGDYSNAGLIYDESADEFAFMFTDETGSTAGNVTIASYAAVRVGSITESSSIAIKENIFDFTSPLEKISKVRPVKYNRKTSKDRKEIGLIAEELAEIFPELVENDKDGNPTSVNYTRAVTVLFDGFKQMYKELKEIKEKIN